MFSTTTVRAPIFTSYIIIEGKSRNGCYPLNFCFRQPLSVFYIIHKKTKGVE